MEALGLACTSTDFTVRGIECTLNHNDAFFFTRKLMTFEIKAHSIMWIELASVDEALREDNPCVK